MKFWAKLLRRIILIDSFFVLVATEMKRYYRDKKRFLASIVLPIIWLLIFGAGFGLSFRYGFADISYQQYILPGIIGMTILFGSMWSGSSLLKEKQNGMEKITKTSTIPFIMLIGSKTMATSVFTSLQVIILLALYSVFISFIPPYLVFLVLCLAMLLAFVFSLLGILIVSFVDTQESYDTVTNILILPLLFLSGALFPVDKSVIWMQYVSNANPLTYGIDAMHNVLLGVSNHSIYFDVGVILSSLVVLFFLSKLAIKN